MHPSLRRRATWPLWVAAWLLSGCSVVIPFDPNLLQESSPARCQDGVDNDENGLTDCAEPGCQIFPFCQEQTAAACRDRNDNDRDGLVDCLDPDCHVFAPCNEALQHACSDGADNNGDGLVDCGDFTCLTDPHCCTDLDWTWEDTLRAGPGAAAVQTCDASQWGSAVNGFDPDRWVAFGVPAPRPGPNGVGLDPNQCAACFAAGACTPCGDAVLLSLDSHLPAPGLSLSATLRLDASDPQARAGVAWTDQTAVPEGAPCGDANPALRRRIGVQMEPAPGPPGESRVTFVLDDVPVGTARWPGHSVVATLVLDATGYVRFHLSDASVPLPDLAAPPTLRAPLPVESGGAPWRVAVHGRGAGLRVDRVVVRSLARCFDPSLAAPAAPPGAIRLSPGPGWDHGMVSDPVVFWWQDALHLLYVGRATPYAAGAIGHAVASSEASAFARTSEDRPMLDGAQVADWLRERVPDWDEPEILDLSAPTVHVREDTVFLYVAVTERDGDHILTSWILGLRTRDLVTFEPLTRHGVDPHTALPGETLSLLSGADPGAGDWERGVGAPAIVARDDGDYVLFYTGRSDPADPFTSAIGVAVSRDGVHWERGARADGLPPTGPALMPPPDSLIYTGMSDPTASWVPSLSIFRLWYVQRQAGSFSIRYAQANAEVTAVRDYPGNPILRPPPGPACDDQYLDGPTVLVQPQGRVSLWYHGRSAAGAHAICYAASPGAR